MLQDKVNNIISKNLFNNLCIKAFENLGLDPYSWDHFIANVVIPTNEPVAYFYVDDDKISKVELTQAEYFVVLDRADEFVEYATSYFNFL